MPTVGTERWSFRRKPITALRMAQIAEHKGGLTETQVIDNAVEMYHRSMFGRRSADLTPPAIRPTSRRANPKG